MYIFIDEMEAEVLDVHCFLSPDLDADDVVVWTALAPNKRVISQLTFQQGVLLKCQFDVRELH